MTCFSCFFGERGDSSARRTREIDGGTHLNVSILYEKFRIHLKEFLIVFVYFLQRIFKDENIDIFIDTSMEISVFWKC